MSDGDIELSSWTLGDIRKMGMVLEGACKTPACNEFARFDVDGLIGKFGPDWRVPTVLPVTCPQCGEPLAMQLAVLHDDAPE